jgi:F420-non-reducing hydrogenase large subunit
MQRISIDPITRLEGHGKIDIFLDDEGISLSSSNSVRFERFCVGAGRNPNLHQRICGVCPEAHHMAGAKAVDQSTMWLPALPRCCRTTVQSFYQTTPLLLALAGWFHHGPNAVAERNILGVIKSVCRW